MSTALITLFFTHSSPENREAKFVYCESEVRYMVKWFFSLMENLLDIKNLSKRASGGKTFCTKENAFGKECVCKGGERKQNSTPVTVSDLCW